MSDYTLEPIVLQLTKGRATTIDVVDSDLASFKWSAQLAESNLCYAVRHLYGDGKKVRHYLHRDIMSRILNRPLKRSEHVDHKDGDGLNNRRDNLRLASAAQNTMNAKCSTRSSSGLKGVRYEPHKYKTHRRPIREYRAQITVDGKTVHLGNFATAEQAHAAYREAAKKFFGEFCRFE